MYWVYLKQDASYQAYCLQNGISQDNCNLLVKLWNDLLNVKPVFILIIFGAFLLSNYFRSLRWRIMLESIDYKVEGVNSIGSILVGYLANLGLPRSGEVIRAALLTRYEKVPITVSVGTVLLDRLIDLLSMCCIVVFTILTQYETFLRFHRDHLSNIPIFQQIIIPLLSILLLIIIYTTREKWKNFSIVKQIIQKLKGFLVGLLAIRKIRNKSVFIFYTVMIWFWFFVMMYASLQSFAPTAHLSISTALVIYVFGSMGMLVPTPGGMGSYHFLVILALSYFEIQEVEAFSFANISFFAAQFANNIVLGIGAMLVLYFYNRKKPIQNH
ncbi:MAG: flippase-like domain-containing protein [Saprospiraceae bacterium]|nr:flippase-like domain-containing protein [Saprospiraceae bacterium]